MDHSVTHLILLRAFENQDALNSRLAPDWAKRGFHYYRAAWTEIAEAVTHMNWIWWKAATYEREETEDQMADVHLELCDILHFGLSMDIVRAYNSVGTTQKESIDYHARTYAQWFTLSKTLENDFYHDIEKVVLTAISAREFDIEHFAKACTAADLSLAKLMTLYFSKATLNRFRWDHGYNIPKGEPGAYIKMWHTPEGAKQEDNAYLTGIVRRLVARNTEEDLLMGLAEGHLERVLYNLLEKRYEEVVAAV